MKKKTFIIISAVFDIALIVGLIVGCITAESKLGIGIFVGGLLAICLLLEVFFVVFWDKMQTASERNKRKRILAAPQAKPIKKTFIIDTNTKKSLAGALARDYIFGLAGLATQKGTRIFTFLIIFEDDTRSTEEVAQNTPRFNELIKYLEVGEN